MKMIESDIKKRGLSGIFLQTDSDKPSYRFYKKNDFSELNTHVSFYKSVKGKNKWRNTSDKRPLRTHHA